MFLTLDTGNWVNSWLCSGFAQQTSRHNNWKTEKSQLKHVTYMDYGIYSSYALHHSIWTIHFILSYPLPPYQAKTWTTFDFVSRMPFSEYMNIFKFNKTQIQLNSVRRNWFNFQTVKPQDSNVYHFNLINLKHALHSFMCFQVACLFILVSS
jgi:hypothetical protein